MKYVKKYKNIEEYWGKEKCDEFAEILKNHMLELEKLEKTKLLSEGNKDTKRIQEI